MQQERDTAIAEADRVRGLWRQLLAKLDTECQQIALERLDGLLAAERERDNLSEANQEFEEHYSETERLLAAARTERDTAIAERDAAQERNEKLVQLLDSSQIEIHSSQERERALRQAIEAMAESTNDSDPCAVPRIASNVLGKSPEELAQLAALLATPEVKQSEPTCTNCHRYPATGQCSDCGLPFCPRCTLLRYNQDGTPAHLCDSCYQERINKVQEALP
jgi:hypothetical protein